MPNSSLTGAWRGGGYIVTTYQDGRPSARMDIDLRTDFYQAGRCLMGAGQLGVTMFGQHTDAGSKEINGEVEGTIVQFTFPSRTLSATGQRRLTCFNGILSPCGKIIDGTWYWSGLDQWAEVYKGTDMMPNFETHFRLERDDDSTPKSEIEMPNELSV